MRACFFDQLGQSFVPGSLCFGHPKTDYFQTDSAQLKESLLSKPVPLKDFGVPVPSPAPAATCSLVVYYGPTPMTPAYTPVAPNGRIVAGLIPSLTVKTVNGVAYYDDPISAELPQNIANGSYDFSFTIMDTNGAEGDFSPIITAVVDTVVPPKLGQPIELT